MGAIAASSTRRSVLRETLHLGVPATLSMISHWFVGIVDLHMVGRLAHGATPERGVQAIANVNIALLYNLAMVIAFEALTIGTQAVTARRWGEGDRHAASRALTSSALIALALAAVLTPLYLAIVPGLVNTLTSGGEGIHTPTIVAYLQIRYTAVPATLLLFALRGWFNGLGNTRIVLGSVLLVNAVNIGLNWVLIEGHAGFPRMEERGAALASALAHWSGLLFLGVYTLAGRAHRALRPLRTRGDRVLMGRIVRIALPAFIHHGLMFTGFLLFIGAIVPRTPDGATGAAAAAIVWHVSGLSYMLSVGFGIAAATMLGQALGSGDLERGRRGVWTAARLGFVGCVLVAFVSILCAGPIARFFTEDAEVGRFVFWLLVINAMFQSFDNYGIVIGEAFKGAGMTRFVMMIEVPLNLLLFLGLAWLLGVHLGHGVIAAWLPLPLYAVTLGVILIVAFRRGLWTRGKA